jgi:hypothetical protein
MLIIEPVVVSTFGAENPKNYKGSLPPNHPPSKYIKKD